MNEYVQNNLLVHYDGINNIITKHDNSTNVWKTTKGNLDGNINGATWNNNSLMFDGNSYVSIDQINTQNITYEAVFNSTEPSEYVPLIANVEGGGCTLSTRHSPYRAYGQCYINGQYRTLNTSTLEDNKDYLVTMTFDGTTLKLYLMVVLLQSMLIVPTLVSLILFQILLLCLEQTLLEINHNVVIIVEKYIVLEFMIEHYQKVK